MDLGLTGRIAWVTGGGYRLGDRPSVAFLASSKSVGITGESIGGGGGGPHRAVTI
jgi:hypothetical protein